MSRAGLAGLACLSLAATASRAADWNGSYAADGRCYCSGTLDSALSSRIVPTPLGGQSVATVCGRIGKGPGLSLVDGRFDRVVYADAQCGHGPGADGDRSAEADCSGTMEPGGDDCHVTGPRWDLASAYARPTRRAVEASVAQIGASVMGAPAVVPAMGAAAPVSVETPADAKIVEIAGRRWREAPAGTPERGAPGTRIVLDGKVFLDVELASEDDFLPRGGRSAGSSSKAPRAAAARPTPAPTPRAAAASPSPSAESLQARRERLLAEARERLREREARERAESAEATSAPVTSTAAAGSESAGTPSVTASTTDDTMDAAPPVGAANERVAESASPDPVDASSSDASTTASVPAADAVASDELADADADAVTESVGTLAEGEDGETLSPFMQALRMPAETRPSSREFGYVDAMPASWDYGGGGLMLEGSAAVRERFRAIARVGAASDYQELLLGGSWYTTPARADRMTLVLTAGVETGRFELDGVRDGRRVGTDLSDTGLYLGAASRFVVNRRFELQAGVGYSSFFDGDPTLFGGSYFHIGRQLDIVSRVEVGDNDSLGIGVRYYY